MNKEIVIVTAFFDIHREGFEVYQRSADQYFEYFRFWARLQNRVIVYCQQNNYDKIYRVREEFGLADKTEIIVVDDIYQIEPEIYRHMCEVSGKESFRSSRYFDVALSNRADYDYVMLLKYWCMFDASKRIQEDVFFVWLDFGFNHGGKLYTNPEDFAFKWEHDFDDAITVFCLSDPDEMTGIESLLFQKDCIIGTYFVLPKHMIKEFWEKMRTAMCSLLSLDCIDDDQHLLLMVYKLHRDWFKVIVSDWFELFLLCSSQSFLTKTAAPRKSKQAEEKVVGSKPVIEQQVSRKPGIKQRVKSKLKNKLGAAPKETEPVITVTKSRAFAERMYNKAVKFYGP